MTIETDIPGDASGLISLGSWLGSAPGDAVSGAGMPSPCEVGSEWQGATAEYEGLTVSGTTTGSPPKTWAMSMHCSAALSGGVEDPGGCGLA